MKHQIAKLTKASLLAVALLALAAASPAPAASGNPGIMPPQSHPYGKTYGDWSAAWWIWAMQWPPVAGHPFIDDPAFNIATGQSGQVWFVAAPFGTVTRNCTVPA